MVDGESQIFFFGIPKDGFLFFALFEEDPKTISKQNKNSQTNHPSHLQDRLIT